MVSKIGMNLYKLLGMLEHKNNLFWLDGLHRQVLFAVLNAELSGIRLTSQQISDMGFTSRSSTYRKISDLKQHGFIVDDWHQNHCFIKLGDAAHAFFKDTEAVLAEI